MNNKTMSKTTNSVSSGLYESRTTAAAATTTPTATSIPVTTETEISASAAAPKSNVDSGNNDASQNSQQPLANSDSPVSQKSPQKGTATAAAAAGQPQQTATAGGGAATPNPQTQFSWNKNEEFHFQIPPEAPVFTPNIDEFKNPLLYISKIRPIAEKYGICKIKPPPTWQPPFTVDVDKLRFTPRIQRLNELEAKTRVKLNFLDQIAKFWELQGSSLKIPMVERKALDLYSLHRIVQEEGGMEQVINNRKWSKVASRMGYPQGKCVGTILKSHYERILYPFDVYTSGKSVDMKLEEQENEEHDYKPHCIESRQQVTPPNETTARRSKRFTQPVVKAEDANGDDIKVEPDDKSKIPVKLAEAASKLSPIFKRTSPIKDQKSRMSFNKMPDNFKKNMSQDPLAKYICHTCNRGDVEEAMLLCDGCDDSYHTFCLLPPLADIPKGDWRCPKCVVEEVNKPTEAFGFEQAQREYTLQQFGEMADQFKSDYFNMPVHLVPTELVEREFWRIVASIDEDVTVEYGADLHTLDHGSGFPTKSSLYMLPGDQEYAESSWNLNNLPLLEESILGHINADISGMKVPWMYVGMCFATFCWHNEDHWSYSINYLHWGEAKTWYGVPGNEAEAFERTMKRAAPELFQSQPDLLHQLVTIMNPNILMNAGVPLYRTDQHAGEFVITFPRAYHAGFNQGYNFAEAVNFAPADWMKMGRECINHYSTLRRFCVFSHDELVCKMALEPDRLNFGIATACYLDMAEMVDSEKKLRKSLLDWGVTKAERQAFELIPDDERQCEVCKTTCFLSAVTCPCSKNLVCLRHYTELCKCAPDKHTLQYRYTLDELPLMLRKLKVKSDSFEGWIRRISDVVNRKHAANITLEDLKKLAHEAEHKKYPNTLLIERLNSAVLEAEKCVTVIQQLEINKMRTRTRNSFENSKYKLSLDELEMFVQEIDNLWCTIKEGSSVKDLHNMGLVFINSVNKLLALPLNKLDNEELENSIEEGYSLCIELPQIFSLKDRLSQLNWYLNVRELRTSKEKRSLTMLKSLLTEGMKLTPDPLLENELVDLDSLIKQIDEWEMEAKACFDKCTAERHIPMLEDLIKRADKIDGVLPSYGPLKDAVKRVKEWLSTVEILQTNENYPYIHTLENIVNRGKYIPFQLEELKKISEHLAAARTWKDQTNRTFLKKKSVFSLMEILLPRAASILPPKTKSDENLSKKFKEEISPVQMVASYKEAELKEIQEMVELRRWNLAKNPESDLYCVCNNKFYGLMYNCQLCKNWFHAHCVAQLKNTSRSRLNTTNTSSSISIPPLNDREKDRESKYLCVSCIRSRRPRLEAILSLLVSFQRLPIRIPEGEALQCLTERAMNWQDRARQFLMNENILREIEKLKKFSAQRPDAKNAGAQQPHTTTTTATGTTAAVTTEIIDSSSDEENNENEVTSGPSPTNIIEHAYSVMSPTPPIKQFDKTSNSISKAEPSLIKLSKSIKESLEELMMEGDLLEVSLDETLQIWRILNAAKPNYSDLAYINHKYKIATNPEDLNLVNIKKRKSEEANVKKAKCHKLSSDNSVAAAAAAALKHSSAAATMRSEKIDECDEKSASQLAAESKDENAVGDGATAGVAATVTTSTATAAASSVPAQNRKSFLPLKMKRGRKIKMRLDNSLPNITELNAKKKKDNLKKRKKNVSLSNEDDKTSDDDEECSAWPCEKPTGSEVDWVQCDGGCEKWFHMFCVGLAKNQIRPDDDFNCEKCKATKGPTNHSDRKENSQIHNKLKAATNGKVVDPQQSGKT